MSSMRDPDRPWLPAVRTPIEVAYWAGAVASGVIVGLHLLASPVDFIVLLAIGITATMVGRRIEGGAAQHRATGWLWVAIFALVWLPIAFVMHHFPFGR